MFGKIASRARAEFERGPSEHITVLSSKYFCELDHLCQVCSTCTRGSREIYAKKVAKHPRPETTVEIEKENNFNDSPPIYLLILHQQILATLSHPFPNSENRMVKKRKKVYHHWKEDNLVSSEFLPKKKQTDGFFLLFCKYCLEYPKQTSKRSSVSGG